jgi:hypothetical protein
MKTALSAILLLVVSVTAVCAGEPAAPPAGYLDIVRIFADTLITHGTDTVGPRRTAMFASVIDTRDFSIPRSARQVPATPGVRESDRAVGGCNPQLDAHTLRTMLALSSVTGDDRYSTAVRAYLADFIALAQSSQTGLLAWGEHLYYDFYRDAVAVERIHHEYLEWTPPLDLLWNVDPEAVRREAAGLRYHFYAEDPAEHRWLFNRHATWGAAVYQKPGGQPWIKHTGLYAYVYGFVSGKTGDAEARRRALGVGSLYYEARDATTGLTEGCLTDPRPTSRNASLGGTSMLAYWLIKAAQADPQLAPLRTRGLELLHAYADLAWDEESGSYAEWMPTSGQRPAAGKRSPWGLAYSGGSGLLRFGRIAAFIARTEKDEQALLMARRAWEIVQRHPMPEKFTPEEAGFAIHLALDLHGLTGDAACLDAARGCADRAIGALLHNGLFRRLPGDPWYESKVGPGDLASALLRLHLRLTGAPDPAGVDWSF